MKFDSYTNDKLWSTVNENQPRNIQPFKCKEKNTASEAFRCLNIVQRSGRFSWFSASVIVVNLDIAVEEDLGKASSLALPSPGIYELILD